MIVRIVELVSDIHIPLVYRRMEILAWIVRHLLHWQCRQTQQTLDPAFLMSSLQQYQECYQTVKILHIETFSTLQITKQNINNIIKL